MERFVLACVSLGLLVLAVFVGQLYFFSSAFALRLALFFILFLFAGIIVMVNVLFNSRR